MTTAIPSKTAAPPPMGQHERSEFVMANMYRVRTVFSGVAGAPWVSTAYFTEVGGTAQQAATAAGVFWSAVDASMSTAVTWLIEDDVDTVDTATGNVVGVTNVVGPTGSGSAAGQLLPRQTQALLRLRTGFYAAGREIRGRWFIPGMTETDNDAGGVPTPALRTLIDNAAVALMNDVNSQWVVFSPLYSTAPLVASPSTWQQWASLRSRRD